MADVQSAPTPVAAAPPAARAVPRSTRLLTGALDNVVWILVVVLSIAAGLRDSFFLTTANLQNVLIQATALGVLVLSVSLVLLLGEIDLSFVGNVVFSATIGALLMRDAGLSGPLAAVVVIGVGTCVGVLNGVFVALLRMNSLIATLAMGLFLQGAVLAITKGQSITIASDSYTWPGTATIGGWPLLPVALVLFYVGGGIVLGRTAWGRKLYAVGGNARAAQAAGIDVRRVRLAAFVGAGALAGCASYLLSSYLGSISVDVGSDLLLYTVAAPVIGGVSLQGGRGRVIGMLGGTVLLTVVQVGLQIVNISSYYVQMVGGVMILLAVAVDAFRVRREESGRA